MCTCLHLHLQLVALDGWYLYLATQCCRWEVKQQVVYQVVLVTNKGIVLFFLDKHLYVTVDALVTSCVTFAGNVDNHPLSYTGRNLDFHDFLAFDNTRPATFVTFVLDDGTLTATGGANALGLHHSEDALGGMGDDTRTMTRRTLFVSATHFGTCAVTMRAGDVLAYLEFLGNAMGNLLQ